MSAEFLSPAIDILKELVSTGTVSKLLIAKATLDTWNGYTQARDIEGLSQFVNYLAEKVGDLEQLLSAPYLKTPEGQRFAHKIVSAAVDPKLAEKRELFANAFINGMRSTRGELGDLDRLRFIDLLTSLSAASLVELALIHKYCEPLFLVEEDADLATIDITKYRDGDRPRFMGETGGAVHYHEAVLRELKSAGVFARKSYRRLPDGSATMISHVQGEDHFYTCYTRAFALFISPLPKEP